MHIFWLSFHLSFGAEIGKIQIQHFEVLSCKRKPSLIYLHFEIAYEMSLFSKPLNKLNQLKFNANEFPTSIIADFIAAHLEFPTDFMLQNPIHSFYFTFHDWIWTNSVSKCCKLYEMKLSLLMKNAWLR